MTSLHDRWSQTRKGEKVMKKLLLTLLLVCMVLPMASLPAYATKPTDVSGEIEYLIDLPSLVIRTAGPNTFMYGTDEEWYTGDFVGYVAETEFVVRAFGSGLSTFMSVFEFEGTVFDSDPGTMEILLIGQQSAPGEWWNGTWVILGGSGGLAKVHGQGIWYEGQVHFDP
jgi:hypothetical protein